MSRITRTSRLSACALALACLLMAAMAAGASANHNAVGELISTGSSGGNGDFPATFKGTSQDGNYSWFETDESLVPQDTDTRQDVYQKLNGYISLISTGATGGNGNFAASYAGASVDGLKVFIFTNEQLEATDTDSQTDVYQVSGGVTTKMSTGPNGGNGARNASFAGASADGTHVFIHTMESLVSTDTDSSQDVYDRTGGSTIHVSRGVINGNGSFPATYKGSSTDGARYFFETSEKLTSGDTDDEIDVYERSGGTTTWLSFGPSGGNGDPLQSFHAHYAGSSADGLKVYFETDEILTSDDLDPTVDVYQRQGGVTSRISTGPNGGNDQWDASYRGSIADGTKVWFQTNEPIVSGDTDSAHTDVYERSNGTTTTLLSTGPTDTNAQVDSSFAAASLTGNRVFISTSAQLTSTDTDGGSRDVYERLNGTTTTLMSTSSTDPQGAFNAFYAGSSSDGTRLYFHTDDSLLASDTDQTVVGPFPAVNEVQSVVVDATGGTFTLSFNSQTTGPIAFDAAPSAVQSALEALSNFAPGDVSVTGSASNYNVEFTGVYAATNVNQLVGNGANLTGGAATVTVDSVTQGSPAQPAQTVGQQDVYERQSGATTHLSIGPTGGNDTTLGAVLVGASPDGTKVFIETDESLATEFDTDSRKDVYAALVAAPFPRPGGGTPLRTPLMLAYKQCTSPNSQHVTPLSNPSCTPPVLESTTLTTGTTGKQNGTARLDALPGNTGTPADEADVRVNVSATDVRNASDGNDYPGNLIFRLTLRVSDRGTGTSQALSGTVADSDVSLPVNCTTTPGDSTIGSACSLVTTMDTLVPNFARETKRTVIATRSIKVLDAGVDGTITPGSGSCPPTCGSGDEKAYLESGVFTP
jgi:hypothetical protein